MIQKYLKIGMQVANEIFDYFAGTASRKLEPLDESEMFEDLLPTEEEVQPVEEMGKERELQDSDINADELPVGESDQPVAASGHENSDESYAEQEEMADADAHWDDLASALGLDPVPVKSTRSSARKTAPRAQREDKRGAAEVEEKASKTKEVRSSSKNRERATEGTPELFDADLVEEKSETTGQEELSSMFQPGDRPQAEPSARASDNPPIEEDDDDPFAAFSGARKRREIETEIEDEDEGLTETEAVEEEPTTLQVDEDFVEFEVHDLGGRRDENRETDRRRRRQPERRDRGGRRAKREDNVEERPAARSDTSSDAKRDADKETASSEDEKRSEPPRSRRPARPPRREQVSRRDVEVDVDVDDDVDLDVEAGSADETGKKKPRIPTWDDAITGVVEKNIKRHKSGQPRGGGRRRRN